MDSSAGFSSSDDENNRINENFNKKEMFIELLKSNKILLNKSQLPKIKENKEKAINKMHLEYMMHFGKSITVKQLRKKIQNIKNEIKKKSDINETGNKKIVLKKWENDLLELMGSADANKNPVFSKVPGSQQVGFDDVSLPLPVPLPKPNLSELQHKRPMMSSNENAGITSSEIPQPPKKRKECLKEEDKETRELTTNQLQRKLILDQLKLTKLQIEQSELAIAFLRQKMSCAVPIVEMNSDSEEFSFLYNK